MVLALWALGACSLLEAILWLPPLWRGRRAVALVLIIPLAVISGMVFGADISVWTALVLAASCYRIINLLRVVEQRMQADNLLIRGRRSSWLLITVQLVLLGIAWAQHKADFSPYRWLVILSVGQLVGSTVLLLSTRRHIRTTTLPSLEHNQALRDLPTLTVAIPARNETDDLDACLRSLTASNYPKLEILVLDDCSQNKRTPEIIRQFAHDGVRFISGDVPPERWLAKNFAYHQMVAEANGDILLFCGVDVRFAPNTLHDLVATLRQKQKSMISVVPQNVLPAGHQLDTMLIQPMRYAWEIALPRRLLRRPPVLSTCWLITKQLLREAGGFEAVEHSISPESYFARQAIAHDDGYSFLHASPELGLVCEKSISEQRDTAIRTRYPQLHRRPELVAAMTVAELALLTTPILLLLASLIFSQWPLAVLSGVTVVVLLYFYGQVLSFTYHSRSVSGSWLIMVAGLYDCMLLNRSMWSYEFNEVIWKERNVCLPVMQVLPKLPPLDKSRNTKNAI